MLLVWLKPYQASLPLSFQDNRAYGPSDQNRGIFPSMLIFIYFLFFILSAHLCHLYIRQAHRKNWLDHPNHRSSHTFPTARGGGLIFIALWLMVLLCFPFFVSGSMHFFTIIFTSTLIVAATGFWDDRASLSARYRMLLYALAAVLALYFLGGFDRISLTQTLTLELPWVGSSFAFLAILWSTNLFNFMDGMDGIAAVEALFVLLLGSVFLWLSEATGLAILVSLLAVCVGGFLVWNKPPAKLFMGDVGSASLGFLILLLALISEQLYGIPFLLWMILYMAFLVDATLTLLRRMFAGEKWYEGHRSHAYQRLHQAGWSHVRVLWMFISINVALSILAMMAFFYPNLLLVMLFLSILFMVVLYWVVERHIPLVFRCAK
jgi:Fuc2NAc and GlcNAc transferase